MHMLENNAFFVVKNNGFLSNVFHATSHMIYFDYKVYAFYPKKLFNVLHKLSFHNTIPHRSHSLIGHVIQEL